MQIKQSLESKLFLFLFSGIIFFLINTNIVYAPGECYCDSLKPCNSGYYWITGAGCCCGGFPPIWPGTCCCKSSGLACSLSVSSTEVNVGKSFSVTASAQVSEGLIGSASVDVTWTGGGIFGGGAYTGIVSSGGSGDCGYDSYIFPYYSGEGNFECEDEEDRTVSITASTLGGVTCSKVIVVHCNKVSPPPPPDPCAGVNCGSCRYCSGGNCYYYCSGTSSSCGCTSCTNCGSCAYCSNYNCYSYCSGTDTSCGCTSCTNCNTLDNWYNKGSTYPCCDLTNPDSICTCQDQEYRNYYCSGTSCTYSITNTQTLRSGCNNCGYCKTCSGGACIDKPGVKGTVTNVSLEFIKGAEIKILGLDKSYTTDENGNYYMCDFPDDDYDIVASKQGFNPVNKKLDFDGTSIVMNFDFMLYTAGSDCKPDCSKTTDPEKPRCHADCDGINGCKFYDERTKEACTTPIDRVVGVTESYNETHKLTCCKGSPYLYKKIKGTSLVFPEAENIVRITRIVFFRGQFARMIIDVFE